MPDRATVDEHQLNQAACDRLAAYLRCDLEALEMIGMGHIPYAQKVRLYLSRYDADVASQPESARQGDPRAGGRHLHSVPQAS